MLPSENQTRKICAMRAIGKVNVSYNLFQILLRMEMMEFLTAQRDVALEFIAKIHARTNKIKFIGAKAKYDTCYF